MSTRTRVSAKDLKHNEKQLREVDSWIRDILDLIDDEIKKSFNDGLFSVDHQLKSSFDVPNMKSQAARRKIHSYIISDLACKERGFIVHYTKRDGKYFLHIKWMNIEDEYKINQESEIIKYYNIPVEERDGENRQPVTERYKGMKSLVIKDED